MRRHPLLSLILLAALVACATAPDQTGGQVSGVGVRAWIDRPLEHSQFPLGEVIPIRWHATNSGGIQQVDVLINGQVFNQATGFDHTAQLVSEEIIWTPAAPGEYLIEIVPTGNGGVVGISSENLVTIVAAQPPSATLEPTLTPTGTLEPTATSTPLPTPTDTPQPSPTSTTQPPTLTLPPTWTFTPLVIPPSKTATKSPKPPTPDKFGPPKPNVIAPKDNVIVACPGKVLLQWEAPSDPSGIASFVVELYVSYNSGGSWKLVKKWESLTKKELDVDKETDCGNLYAWKVSARDGAGNLGAYELVQFRTGLP